MKSCDDDSGAFVDAATPDAGDVLGYSSQRNNGRWPRVVNGTVPGHDDIGALYTIHDRGLDSVITKYDRGLSSSWLGESVEPGFADTIVVTMFTYARRVRISPITFTIFYIWFYFRNGGVGAVVKWSSLFGLQTFNMVLLVSTRVYSRYSINFSGTSFTAVMISCPVFGG